MVKLTRQEIWYAICKKYPSLKYLSINSSFQGGVHIRRDILLKIMKEMEVHKSKYLTKEQKIKYNEEIVEKI